MKPTGDLRPKLAKVRYLLAKLDNRHRETPLREWPDVDFWRRQWLERYEAKLKRVCEP